MYKVILVEDEEVIRKGLKKLIEEVIGGYKIIGEACNGKEALELLKTMSPDLLITDIRMEEMNGLEMIKRIRNQYQGMEILIISGHADFEYAKQAIRYGISDYMLKPVDRVELAHFLNQLKIKIGVEQVEPTEGAAQNQEGHIIRRVKAMIAERLDQDISLQYIAEQVHLNHQYLSTLFKAETGQNFSEFVTQCRMNKAKHLLIHTNLKVYEVAKLSGYMSSKHFMAIFKQLVGVTPSEFRDQSM